MAMHHTMTKNTMATQPQRHKKNAVDFTEREMITAKFIFFDEIKSQAMKNCHRGHKCDSIDYKTNLGRQRAGMNGVTYRCGFADAPEVISHEEILYYSSDT